MTIYFTIFLLNFAPNGSNLVILLLNIFSMSGRSLFLDFHNFRASFEGLENFFFLDLREKKMEQNEIGLKSFTRA